MGSQRTLLMHVRLTVVCERCRNDLTHRASVVGGTVWVWPCDHCLGQAELRATREVDDELLTLIKELEAAKAANRTVD